MTLASPSAMSIIGDATQVRHLRAAGKSWAVWTFNNGNGDQWAVRERTGSVALVGSLRTDGTDFSDRVLPIAPRQITTYHCLEIANEQVLFLFSDKYRQLRHFTWNVTTNTLITPIEDFAIGDLPSQIVINAVLRQFYVRNQDVLVRADGGAEQVMLDPSATEAFDIDMIRKGIGSFARYIGVQAINRDLALPFLPEASTILCYDGTTQIVQVTEGLPPGTVGYFTFDTADFSGSTMMNQAGAFNATLVGAAPASVAGQVNQARDFAGGSADGHYSLGNPAALQIVGDLSIAFWINPDNFNQRVTPYAKAYGGEGTVVLENAPDPGYFNFFYGTGGIDGHTYGAYPSVERITLSRWTHVVLVRDLTNRFVRWFFDGELVRQSTAWVTPAVASGQSATIGKNFTGQCVDGKMDELLIANQAWSPQSVNALYEKGRTNVKADTSGTGGSRRLVDLGAASRHATLSRHAAITPTGIAQLRSAMGGDHLAGVNAFTMPAALTVEARIFAKTAHVELERRIVGTYADPSSLGARVQGTFVFFYRPDGSISFRFETASASVELRQTGGTKIQQGALNYVAVSHTFGAGVNTLLVVNGDQVPARWIGGGGDETPTLLSAAPMIQLNAGDEIRGIRVSNVAKSLTTLRNYLRGRS